MEIAGILVSVEVELIRSMFAEGLIALLLETEAVRQRLDVRGIVDHSIARFCFRITSG
jgi:hypothetical protein